MTSKSLPSVSVGFPVYNEEETVGEVLKEAHELLLKSDLKYEILVCDDGSTDSSFEIIQEIASRFPHFRVIRHPSNRGIRAAFESLYESARLDFIFINAVDKQWETGILLDMLPLTEKADIVIATRKRKPYTLTRRFISWGFNALPYVLFGVRTYDAGSVKLIRREVINRFPVISESPFSEAERLIRAARAGCRIVYYAVSVLPRKTGRARGVTPNAVLSALRDVFRVWRSIHCREKKDAQ